MMKEYRVKRPAAYSELLNLLRDKELGVFTTLKSALVFSAVVGFKQGCKLSFTSSESDEPIALRHFSDEHDIPLMYLMAIAENKDIGYLRENNFDRVVSLFEEYAAGGLEFLDLEIDKGQVKSSIEKMLFDSRRGTDEDDIIGDIMKG